MPGPRDTGCIRVASCGWNGRNWIPDTKETEGFSEEELRWTGIGRETHPSAVFRADPRHPLSRYKCGGARCLPRDGMNLSPTSAPPLQYRFRLFRGILVCAPFRGSIKHAVYLKDRTTRFRRRGLEEKGERGGRILEICFRAKLRRGRIPSPNDLAYLDDAASSSPIACLTAALLGYKGCQWWGISFEDEK